MAYLIRKTQHLNNEQMSKTREIRISEETDLSQILRGSRDAGKEKMRLKKEFRYHQLPTRNAVNIYYKHTN